MRSGRTTSAFPPWVLGGASLLVLCSAAVLWAVSFQMFQVDSSNVEKVLWGSPNITWTLNPELPNDNAFSAQGTVAARDDLASAVSAAFDAWQSATYKNLQVDGLLFTETSSDSQLAAPAADCTNVVGFTGALATGTIAQTVVTYVASDSAPFQYGAAASALPCASGVVHTCPYRVCIADADIEFNSAAQFATYADAPMGQYDLQSIATHEIGHLIGLDHSGIAHSVMYPYGDLTEAGVQRTLSVDDEIGALVLYPNAASGITALASEITGTVTVGGSAAFAVHLVALDPASGNVVTDTLSEPSGTYHLRVFEGTYNVLALPLAPDLNSGAYTIDNFNLFACGYSTSSSACVLPLNAFTNYTGQFY